MEDFGRWVSSYQAAWRRENISSDARGWWRGRQYGWILPTELWEEGLWSGIRSGSDWSLPAYVRHNNVKKHNDIHNLKSSWTLCANLYFPFGQSEYGRSLLAGFLKAHVSDQVQHVDALELEYAETGDLHPSRLLGEQGGMRGAGQTSPDIGLLVNGHRGLILAETKFAEHSFYPCSAHWGRGRGSRPPNPHPERCNDPLAGLQAAIQCHQNVWGRK